MAVDEMDSGGGDGLGAAGQGEFGQEAPPWALWRETAQRVRTCAPVGYGRFERLPAPAGAAINRALRTGGRVVEGARLERVYGCKPIEGSNPSLSAGVLQPDPS